MHRRFSARGYALMLLGLAVLLGGAVAARPARAAEGWPHIVLQQVAEGFVDPVHIDHAGDGSGRLFVVEQRGIVRIIQGGAPLATPFLDIQARVLRDGDEQGLLSIAFPPAYASQGHFYVNYTRRPDGATVIARFRRTTNPNVADPASEEIVLTIAQPHANHNGGQLAFGPNDGYLYIGMGDGGSANDPDNRGQAPSTLLGKLLRIDVETGSPLTYTIPASNPYTQTAGYRPEIWALGLRNPWRFSFDRQTGDLYMGDVGQRLWEEVNFQPGDSPGGENYGWRILEGTHCFNPATGCTPPARYVPPVAEYDHGDANCSVTGGYLYEGIYYYADFCSGRIWGLRRAGANWPHALLYDAPFGIATFGRDEAGRLYVADYDGGVIYRLLTSRAYVPISLK